MPMQPYEAREIELTEERDALRAEVKRLRDAEYADALKLQGILGMLIKGAETTICMWCGAVSSNTDESRRSHLAVCDSHPLRTECSELRAEVDELKKQRSLLCTELGRLHVVVDIARKMYFSVDCDGLWKPLGKALDRLVQDDLERYDEELRQQHEHE